MRATLVTHRITDRTIIDEDLAKTGRRKLDHDCHSADQIRTDSRLGKIWWALSSTKGKKFRLIIWKPYAMICLTKFSKIANYYRNIFLTLCCHKTSKLQQNFAFLFLFIQFNVSSELKWVAVSSPSTYYKSQRRWMFSWGFHENACWRETGLVPGLSFFFSCSRNISSAKLVQTFTLECKRTVTE